MEAALKDTEYVRSPHNLSYTRDLLPPDPSKMLLDNQDSL